jgi:hypothetical protein
MIVIDGKLIPTPGYTALNWHDNPEFRMSPNDGAPRGGARVNMVGIHTTEGVRAIYRPGLKDHHQGAQQYIKSWRRSKRQASAHVLIVWDGIVYQIADLQTEMTYHIGGVNRVSIGIEIVQIEKIIYQGQLEVLAKFCSHISELFGIQPMIHFPYHGRPVERIRQGKFFGFFGHRDYSDDRGYGDPNDEPLLYLRDYARFETFDVDKNEDIIAWKDRQSKLMISDTLALNPDGMPGRATHEALKRAGYKNGIWVYGR